LTAKEGSADGWDSYRIGGSVADPSVVRLTPASDGQGLTSKPLGIDPFDPFALTVTSQRAVTLAGHEMHDYTTAEGVEYRLDHRGELVWLQAPVATRGDLDLAPQEAEAAALRFLSAHVPAFDASSFRLISDEEIAHSADERLRRLTWRRKNDGTAGPAAITVEVDRRTGAVVFLAVARVQADAREPAVDRDAAISAARRALDGGGTLLDARLDVWDRARWIVTFEDGAGPAPNVVRVSVDAITGEVHTIRRT